MKLSISNIAWDAASDETMYAFLQKKGFHGLEIAPTRIFPVKPYDQLTDARNWSVLLKKEYCLEISSMQSIWYGRTENLFTSANERRWLLEYTKKIILFANAVKCKNIVFGCPKNRDTDCIEKNYVVAVDFFRELGAYAREYDTVIAIEANPIIYHTQFINTTKEAFLFAQDCISEGIKVNVDLGAILYNEENLGILLKYPHLINHVHISEPFLAPIVDRNLLFSLKTILMDINYEGYVSIEMSKLGIDIVKDVVSWFMDKWELQ